MRFINLQQSKRTLEPALIDLTQAPTVAVALMGAFEYLKCFAMDAQLTGGVIVLIDGIRMLVVETENALVSFIVKLEHFNIDIAAFGVILEQDFYCAIR